MADEDERHADVGCRLGKAGRHELAVRERVDGRSGIEPPGRRRRCAPLDAVAESGRMPAVERTDQWGLVVVIEVVLDERCRATGLHILAPGSGGGLVCRW